MYRLVLPCFSETVALSWGFVSRCEYLVELLKTDFSYYSVLCIYSMYFEYSTPSVYYMYKQYNLYELVTSHMIFFLRSCMLFQIHNHKGLASLGESLLSWDSFWWNYSLRYLRAEKVLWTFKLNELWQWWFHENEASGYLLKFTYV